jgi:release factor glutamine methyltransferase
VTETVEATRARAARALRAGGVETPALDARLLLCHATGLSHEALIAHGRAMLEPDAAARFDGYIARRLTGAPVSRIRGFREFYGRSFRIDAQTLDPRPDTETLIEAALDLVAQNGWRQRKLKILDLGTGSGCLLLTLLAELPRAEGLGTDLSEGALQTAAGNARRLGLGSRARFAAANWLQGVDGRFDLIVSNPPYIASAEIAELAPEVAAHDPRLALDGGPDGLDAYRRIAQEALGALRPGGCFLVEIGAAQGETVPALLSAAGLEVWDDGIRRDLAGRPRCVLAGRPSEGATEGRKSAKMRLENRDVQGSFMLAE